MPYLYGIFGNINFVFMQIFFKMLTTVLPQSIVLSLQAFLLLTFNSFILVSSQNYQSTYKKYGQ
jgi:hypothetical protein